MAIAIASERPDCRVLAVDVSQNALAVARSNAAGNAVEDRVEFAHGSWWDAVTSRRTFDLVVSNPPYMPTASLDGLMTEVRDHEPRLALDGGADGLVVFRELFDSAPHLLAEGGWMGLEVEGERQANELVHLFGACGGWRDAEVRKDYGGIPRVVFARRDS